MLRLPLGLLLRCQPKRELLHGSRFSGAQRFLVNPRRGIGFGGYSSQLRYIQFGLSNEVVTGHLVPIEYIELNVIIRLIPPYMEDELLLPGRVERVTNYSSTEDLFAKGDDHEGVHIPARTSHCEGSRHWFDL